MIQEWASHILPVTVSDLILLLCKAYLTLNLRKLFLLSPPRKFTGPGRPLGSCPFLLWQVPGTSSPQPRTYLLWVVFTTYLDCWVSLPFQMDSGKMASLCPPFLAVPESKFTDPFHYKTLMSIITREKQDLRGKHGEVI